MERRIEYFDKKENKKEKTVSFIAECNLYDGDELIQQFSRSIFEFPIDTPNDAMKAEVEKEYSKYGIKKKITTSKKFEL
jgi:hypothetical protein